MSTQLEFTPFTDDAVLWNSKDDANDFFTNRLKVKDATAIVKGGVQSAAMPAILAGASTNVGLVFTVDGVNYTVASKAEIDGLKAQVDALQAAFNALRAAMIAAGSGV